VYEYKPLADSVDRLALRPTLFGLIFAGNFGKPNDARPVGMESTVDPTGLILKPALNHYFAMLCRLNRVLANNFAQ